VVLLDPGAHARPELGYVFAHHAIIPAFPAYDPRSMSQQETVHLIAHTHWDREWFLPFQSFRIRLVHLVDRLLEILAADPGFTHFMLDGQTIVVDDYLEVRPGRRAEIAAHVASGRLLVGPWTVLPDEFLVSPEALVRNLAFGARAARALGGRMDVGYVPDPFGHVGQLPQILRGFGIDTACFRRGLGDEPCELQWEAPDGSRVLVAYLRDGYDNAARLPGEASAFASSVCARAASLAPHSATPVRLLMNGTDHHEAQAGLPALLAKARADGNDWRLSTLPAYFADLRRALATRESALPVVRGELRDPRRHHLLPGVLSSRVWIKQRNDACERLLETWVEPTVAWAERFCADQPDRAAFTGHLDLPRVRGARDLVDQAWRILLTCHPHDSICGCSVDAVHDEMQSRFDQVEQIGVELRRQSLVALADAVDTSGLAASGAQSALVFFRPATATAAAVGRASVELGAGLDSFELVDGDGRVLPHRVLRREARELARMSLAPDEVRRLARGLEDGRVMGLSVQGVSIRLEPPALRVDVVLAERGEPDMQAVERGLRGLESGLASGRVERIELEIRLATRVELEVLVSQIPAHGWTSVGLRPAERPPAPVQQDDVPRIASDRFDVELSADGTIRVTDRALGARFAGLLALRDVADCGDSYNFCALAGDSGIEAPAGPVHVRRLRDACGETLEIERSLRVPRALAPDRRARTNECVDLPVRTRVSVAPGLPYLDVEIELENTARDHRLSLLCPTGAPAASAVYDGHFELVRRPTGQAPGEAGWVEQPVAEQPMRAFVAVESASPGRAGLLVAAQGLREASVSPDGTLAVTLLRAFGWLSRSDFPARRGGAGPEVPTPGGQCPGPQRYRLALFPFAGDAAAQTARVDAWSAGSIGVSTPLHAGALQESGSFLEISSPEFRPSAVVQSATLDGAIVVRGTWLGAEPGEIRLRARGFTRAERVRLDETPSGDLPVDSTGEVRVAARPNEIVSVRLR
jgi:alpha-mannosidase